MCRKRRLWQSYQRMTNKLHGRIFTIYMEEKLTHQKITRFQEFRQTVFWEYLQVIVVACAAVFGLIRPFVVEAYKIPSSSMEDTLLIGDRILVCKFIYGFKIPGTETRLFDYHKPSLGDVIVFVPPHERHKNYIKRVVALAGDIVETRGNKLFVNGEEIDSSNYTKYVYDQRDFGDYSPRPQFPPFRSQPQDLPTFERWQEFSDFDEKTFERYFKDYTTSLKEYRPFVVPPGYVFVMGDNRDQSYDSRGWGPVALEDIKGRAHVIYWSQGVGAVGKNEVRLYRIGTSL